MDRLDVFYCALLAWLLLYFENPEITEGQCRFCIVCELRLPLLMSGILYISGKIDLLTFS